MSKKKIIIRKHASMFIQTIKPWIRVFFFFSKERWMTEKGFLRKQREEWVQEGMSWFWTLITATVDAFAGFFWQNKSYRNEEKEEFKSFVRLEKCIKSKAWSTIQHFKFLIIYRHCWGGPGAALPKFHWPQEGWDKLDHQKQFHVKHRKNYIVQVHSLCRISLGKCVENRLHCEIYSY